MKIILKITAILIVLIMNPPVYSDSIEEQVSDISQYLMCPVCRGQTVAESNSDLAKDFREIIRKKVEDGESKEQILSYFVDRYGESVLASPPASGVRLIVWILPVLMILLGLYLFFNFLVINRKEENEVISGKQVSKDSLDEVDRQINNE